MYGFENMYRKTPEPPKFIRSTTIGARATYGVPYLSAELEVSRGTNTEDQFSPSKKIETTRESARLGIKSEYRMAQLLSVYVRLGARAKKDIFESTVSGVTEKTESPVDVDPYFGTGLRFRIGQEFSLNAGATATEVINEDGQKEYEMQTTLSWTMGFESK